MMEPAIGARHESSARKYVDCIFRKGSCGSQTALDSDQ
jgi:hypothetical protein